MNDDDEYLPLFTSINESGTLNLQVIRTRHSLQTKDSPTQYHTSANYRQKKAPTKRLRL